MVITRRSSLTEPAGDAISIALRASRGPPVWKNIAVPSLENAGEKAGPSAAGSARIGRTARLIGRVAATRSVARSAGGAAIDDCGDAADAFRPAVAIGSSGAGA